MNKKILTLDFSSIYQLYIQKIVKKGRMINELNSLIYWLTGHDATSFNQKLNAEVSVEDFFSTFPRLNPNANQIKGSICGHKIQDIINPIEKNIRYLDKLVDELAKGKKLEKIIPIDN